MHQYNNYYFQGSQHHNELCNTKGYTTKKRYLSDAESDSDIRSNGNNVFSYSIEKSTLCAQKTSKVKRQYVKYTRNGLHNKRTHTQMMDNDGDGDNDNNTPPPKKPMSPYDRRLNKNKKNNSDDGNNKNDESSKKNNSTRDEKDLICLLGGANKNRRTNDDDDNDSNDSDDSTEYANDGSNKSSVSSDSSQQPPRKIEKEINNIDDLIELGEMFDPMSSVRYELDLRMLHKLIKPLKKLKNMIGMGGVKEDIVDFIIYALQHHKDKKKTFTSYGNHRKSWNR